MSLSADLVSREQLVKRELHQLRHYQTDIIIPFLRNNPFSGAFVDMGLGKTVSVLTVIEDLIARGKVNKVLIIAPLRVAVQTWPTELAEWRHTWWMNHTLIRANEKHPGIPRAVRAAVRRGEKPSPARTAHLDQQKRALANSRETIHVINREAVEWLVNHHGKNWPYDCVIVDESRNFADHRSKRFRALSSVRGRIKRLHLLSGIPAPEGVGDYFAQIYLLDRGERFGRGVTAFRQEYLTYNPYNRSWTPRAGSDARIAEKIKDICLVMREEDHLSLAKPLVIERPILLKWEQLKQYKDFTKNLILELPDNDIIEAETAAALAGKLLQFASGAVYDKEKKWHEVHTHKLDELRQLVEEGDGSPMLVAYWHRSSLERLKAAFPNAVKMDKRGDCVGLWNKGTIPMLLIHPRSAGHGLNMQLGPGHTLVWFDNPLPLEDYLQTIKRLARPGQKKVVKVFHLVTRGTADEMVVPLLRAKDSAQDAVRRMIRDFRKAYLDRYEETDYSEAL